MTESKARTMVNARVYPKLPPHEETAWCEVIGCHPICRVDADAELEKAHMETLDTSVPEGSSWSWNTKAEKSKAEREE